VPTPLLRARSRTSCERREPACSPCPGVVSLACPGRRHTAGHTRLELLFSSCFHGYVFFATVASSQLNGANRGSHNRHSSSWWLAVGCGGRTRGRRCSLACRLSPLRTFRTISCTRSGHTASSPCPGGPGHGPSLPRCQVGLSERAWDPHQGGAGLVSNRCPKSHKLFPVTGSIPSLLGLQTVLAILAWLMPLTQQCG